MNDIIIETLNNLADETQPEEIFVTDEGPVADKTEITQ